MFMLEIKLKVCSPHEMRGSLLRLAKALIYPNNLMDQSSVLAFLRCSMHNAGVFAAPRLKGFAMKLEIDRTYLESLVARFPDLAFLREQLKFGSKVEVPVQRLNADQVDYLVELYGQGGPTLQTKAAQLATLKAVIFGGGKRYEAENLEHVLVDLAEYLIAGGQRGWLFTAAVAGRPLPYVVTRIDFTPASNDETAKVFVELKANVKGSIATTTFRMTGPEIIGKTIGEILASKGFVKETEQLLAAYDESAARYFEWRAQYGKQFSATGAGFYAADPNSSHRDMDWSRKDIVVLTTSGAAARLVNDESILTQRAVTLDAPGDVLGAFIRKAGKSNHYHAESQVVAWNDKIPETMFTQMPVHGYVLMFHLELHHYVWVHVDDMQPYEYQPGLKDKLVLPQEQTDLIDILTAEMDVLMDDIVAGKSGGTTVLCAGPPGVGKTLTAEVYSEIIKRPLYRVHSGQLGLNVSAMETALKDVLTRAQRWGAVMLIDEADVYIRRRDDDMTTNAVVGVFLRVLEYFNGLLFMTTNRVDDIDEAIVSRCIAMIKFNPPDAQARYRIWNVMIEQFDLTVPGEVVAQLVTVFPLASGRDIKGLTKLVAKFCHQKQVEPSLEVFKRCSIFRGMDVAA